jgi:eukaryotic-like serine/threonine-protein kinase
VGSAETTQTLQFANTKDDHPLVHRLVGGKYRVLGLLHRGRRNDIFVAQETVESSVRSLVLKVPHEFSHEAAQVLGRESGFLEVIEHPNVVVAHDVGTDDERAFLVLEPVVGDTLADTLERTGPMDERAVLEIFWQVLSATRAMHDIGVVHRDLRPRNVCLEHREDQPPLVKLIDFASAKFLRDDHPDAAEEPPYPVGAHRYMAPEQHRGETTGPWVDIYAIGTMLHAALAGVLPEPGIRLRERRVVSAELDQVVATAIAEDPSERFANAGYFQDALTRAILIG